MIMITFVYLVFNNFKMRNARMYYNRNHFKLVKRPSRYVVYVGLLLVMSNEHI